MLYPRVKNMLLTGSILLIISCLSVQPSENKHADQLSLIKEHDSLYFLSITSDSTVDRWKLPYPVFRFQTGDIDSDGSEEMLVGVIKRTRFDSSLNKRIFIFNNYEGTVRPLWLGSRLGIPLIDFRFIRTPDGPCIRIVGKEENGQFLVADYVWNQFGLEFKRYVIRNIPIEKAQHQIKKQQK